MFLASTIPLESTISHAPTRSLLDGQTPFPTPIPIATVPIASTIRPESTLVLPSSIVAPSSTVPPESTKAIRSTVPVRSTVGVDGDQEPEQTEAPESTWPIESTVFLVHPESLSATVSLPLTRTEIVSRFGSLSKVQESVKGFTNAEKGSEDDDYRGFLIAVIICFVAFTALFCYMMFKEKEKKEFLSEKKEIEAEKKAQENNAKVSRGESVEVK
jgi:hypothetical protein